jgi:hypothetical protein
MKKAVGSSFENPTAFHVGMIVFLRSHGTRPDLRGSFQGENDDHSFSNFVFLSKLHRVHRLR